ncbi:MAG: hypothetical protein GQ564_13335 [Bacteroidales bacterium]|nr:hypothetical protein [Bacteroidales bacterium]
MSTKRIILFFLAALLVTNISAQYIKNKQFTLFNYDLNISKDFIEEIAELESFVDNVKTYNDPGNDKLNAILVHIIYYNLKDRLTKELEIEILPINTFMREVKYDDYGYPNTKVREAIQKGDSKYYFKVEAQLESITKKKREESPELFENIDYPVTYPELTITITINNKDGIIPIAKWIGTTTPKYPLAINEYLLKGFDNTEMIVQPAEELQRDNLYLMLERAIYNTIQDYHNK